MVPAHSTLAESAGRGPARHGFDFVALCAAATDSRPSDNPYVGIVVFLVLPAIFFTGLLLIPVGVYRSKGQIRRGLAEETFDHKTALQRI